jgi:Protein of unknown function (DUF2652)
MKIQRGIVIIADVSGYTRFLKMHAFSVVHAEWLISELMKSIVGEFKAPAKLNKLEGDAAMFFVPINAEDREDELVKLTTQSALRAFRAFNMKRDEMLAANLCPCCACPEIGNLSVKAICHLGEVIEKRILGRDELAGDTVIIAHRLLKNSLQSREYLLMTKHHYEIAKSVLDVEAEIRDEPVEGYGIIEIAVTHGKLLKQRMGEIPPPKGSIIKGILQVLNMEYYMLKRSARLIQKQQFSHLQAKVS